MSFYKQLQAINTRPAAFQFYTADELWTNEHTSKQMLQYHLDDSIDLSSRNSDFIDRSVEWIVSRFKVGEQSTIADFGCGPGLYTTRLAECGATVCGIDFSETSLKFAKQLSEDRKLGIDYIQANYLNFDTTQRFDLITMIMCDFCVLSPSQRNAMLSRFRSLLKPEGAILLDVYSLTAFDQKQESSSYEFNQLNGFWSAEDYYCFANSFKYDKEKVSLDKYTIIEASKVRTVYNWLQYFDATSLTKEFADAGLRVESLYADVAGQAYSPKSAEFAVVSRKA